MSFNAKNLTYESNEPAFLRKLKGEYGGTDSARHRRPLARPRKQSNIIEDNEDELIYVHETDPLEPVSKAEYDGLLNASATEDNDGLFNAEDDQKGRMVKPFDQREPSFKSQSKGTTLQEADSKQQMAVIGAASKKRSAKVVGDNALADEAQQFTAKQEVPKRQGPKKVKRQKLSFQDE
ncbi:MAG: hypothetical protein Q9225_000654 [Loekoesia sp. 1 TL-2023]